MENRRADKTSPFSLLQQLHRGCPPGFPSNPMKTIDFHA